MIQTYPIVIKANSEHSLSVFGTYINIAESSAPDVYLPIEALNNEGEPVANILVKESSELKTEQFTKLRIGNPTGADITLAIVAGDGDYTVGGTVVQASINPYSTFNGLASVSVVNGATATVAENPSRKRLDIYADKDNAGQVFIQHVGAAAGFGIPLQANGVYQFEVTGAVQLRADGGDAVVYLAEIQ